MTQETHGSMYVPAAIDGFRKILARLDATPWAVLAIVARLATFTVFWRSGTVKLDDWTATVGLFRDEYKVPVLPPEVAAMMGTAVELGGAALVLVGLGARFGALALIGLIAVIQNFVYPMAWPDHLQWLAFLLPLLLWGPGKASIDAIIRKRFLGD